MIRILLLVGFIFFSLPSLAKIEYAKDLYRYTIDQDISAPQSCKIAKAKAKLKALEQGIGQKISNDELEICDSVDGKTNCRQSQFSLFEFNGIVKLMGPPEENWYQKEEGGVKTFVCEVKIKANVTKIETIKDPNFDFSVWLELGAKPAKSFRANEIMKITIDVNKEMYLTIFQIWPYVDSNDFQVRKIFPKKGENYEDKYKDNLIKPAKKRSLEYIVDFPEKIKEEIIDEYLYFVASEKDIKWLNQYNTIEDLKSLFYNSKYKMKYTYKGYIIVNQ